MTILMIRPVRFGFNAQTAVNNAFQTGSDAQAAEIQRQAVSEFDAIVSKLRAAKIDVLVVPDTEVPHTPDSIFPNNWISFHNGGTVVLYPMFAENRRLERKQTVFDALSTRFPVKKQIDYTTYEKNGRFLEGTGSFVLDRTNRLAFACLSPRTDRKLFLQFCRTMNYEPVVFEALDMAGAPIYHTNVMMCVADRYAVVCLDSIPVAGRGQEQQVIIDRLIRTGKTIIPITIGQMEAFAGNMLQVENAYGEQYLVMSTRAYRALDPNQINELEAFNPIIHSQLDTIEQNGGGSARCMMAEVYR